MKNRIIYTVATLSLALFAQSSVAQVTPLPVEVGGQIPGTTQPGNVQPGTEAANLTPPYRVKTLIGSKVYIQNNTAVGTIDDIVLSDAGVVEYLIAEANNQYFTVPFSAAKINIVNRTATVNMTPQVFQTVPMYKAEAYPNYFDPTYRTTTYKYYDLTPRPLQRLRDRIEDRIDPRNP